MREVADKSPHIVVPIRGAEGKSVLQKIVGGIVGAAAAALAAASAILLSGALLIAAACAVIAGIGFSIYMRWKLKRMIASGTLDPKNFAGRGTFQQNFGGETFKVFVHGEALQSGEIPKAEEPIDVEVIERDDRP